MKSQGSFVFEAWLHLRKLLPFPMIPFVARGSTVSGASERMAENPKLRAWRIKVLSEKNKLGNFPEVSLQSQYTFPFFWF